MELCLAKILNALGWWLNFLWIAALKSNLNQYGGKNFLFRVKSMNRWYWLVVKLKVVEVSSSHHCFLHRL